MFLSVSFKSRSSMIAPRDATVAGVPLVVPRSQAQPRTRRAHGLLPCSQVCFGSFPHIHVCMFNSRSSGLKGSHHDGVTVGSQNRQWQTIRFVGRAWVWTDVQGSFPLHARHIPRLPSYAFAFAAALRERAGALPFCARAPTRLRALTSCKRLRLCSRTRSTMLAVRDSKARRALPPWHVYTQN